jgi:hypothetical protein
VLIEYDAQDTVRGDMCVILEFAPEALCHRDAGGLIVANADVGRTFSRALEEFTSQATAMALAKSRHVEELRGLWRGGGTAFRAVKTAPSAPVLLYRSDIVPGALPRGQSFSSSASLVASSARLESRPIKPVTDEPASERVPSLKDSPGLSSLQSELLAMVSKTNSADESGDAVPGLLESPGLSSMQDELDAMVSNAKYARERGAHEGAADGLAVGSEANSIGKLLQDPKGRIAVLSMTVFVMIMVLKVCFGA